MSEKSGALRRDMTPDTLNALLEAKAGETTQNNDIAPQLRDRIDSLDFEDVRIMVRSYLSLPHHNPVVVAALIQKGLRRFLVKFVDCGRSR